MIACVKVYAPHKLHLHKIYDFILYNIKNFFFPPENNFDYDFYAFPTEPSLFSNAYQRMYSLLPFIISFLMSKELKRSSVIGSPAFQRSTFTLLTFWRIVMFIKWHICSEFSLKCSSGEKDLAAGRMFVIAVISVVLLEELATLLSITLCVCVYMCVWLHWGCFLTLIDVSLAVRVLQRSISVIHFLLCVLQRNAKTLEDKSEEKKHQ